jgi:hypothetical protein
MKAHWQLNALIISASLTGCTSAPTYQQTPSAQGHSVRSALAAQVSPARDPAQPLAEPGLDGHVALHILARYRETFKPSPSSGQTAGIGFRGAAPGDVR